MSAEHDLQQLRQALNRLVFEVAMKREAAQELIDDRGDAGVLSLNVDLAQSDCDLGLAALSRVGERIDAQQRELEDWKRQWESACEDIAIVQSEARSLTERVTRAVHFLSWLVSMDDPSNAVGLEQRRTIALTRIIDNARECLSDLAGLSR